MCFMFRGKGGFRLLPTSTNRISPFPDSDLGQHDLLLQSYPNLSHPRPELTRCQKLRVALKVENTLQSLILSMEVWPTETTGLGIQSFTCDPNDQTKKHTRTCNFHRLHFCVKEEWLWAVIGSTHCSFLVNSILNSFSGTNLLLIKNQSHSYSVSNSPITAQTLSQS